MSLLTSLIDVLMPRAVEVRGAKLVQPLGPDDGETPEEACDRERRAANYQKLKRWRERRAVLLAAAEKRARERRALRGRSA